MDAKSPSKAKSFPSFGSSSLSSVSLSLAFRALVSGRFNRLLGVLAYTVNLGPTVGMPEFFLCILLRAVLSLFSVLMVGSLKTLEELSAKKRNFEPNCAWD